MKSEMNQRAKLRKIPDAESACTCDTYHDDDCPLARCVTCRCAPCQCDAMYEEWKDRREQSEP